MTFEELLSEIGSFGRYQRILVFCFLIPCAFLMPWISLSFMFYFISPDHWCHVPAVANSNLSIEMQRQLVSPPEDPSCTMYDIDYEGVLKLENFTLNSSWPRRECAYGWDYDRTTFEDTPSMKFNLVCKNDYLSYLVQCLVFVGVSLGTPLFGFMSDRIGRKPTFLLLSTFIAITDLASAFCPYFSMFLFFRTLHGACLSSIYSTIFIVVLELVPSDMRARVNGFTSLSWSLGSCVLPFLLQYARDWKILSIITTCIAVSFLLFGCLIPESPRWLISQKRYDEATKIMNQISKRNCLTAHEGNMLFEKIEKLGDSMKTEKHKGKSSSFMDFIRYPTVRKRFILLCLCWIASCIPYYGHQLSVQHLSGSVFLNFFYLCAVEVPTNLGTWWLLQKIGRRWCGIIGFTVAAASCIIPLFLSPDHSTVYILAALMGKAGSCSTYMTVYQQAPELFHTPVRAMAIGLASTVGTGSSFVAPYIVYLAKYSLKLPFLIFTLIALMGVISELFQPETKDTSLPQTVEEIEGSQKPESDSTSMSTTPEKESFSESNRQYSSTGFFTPSVKMTHPKIKVTVSKSNEDVEVSHNPVV